MNTKRILASLVAVFTAVSAFGSGFGLYEASAKFHAFGGASVGKAIDASANFVNPATLTDLTNYEFTVGFVTEHPRGEVSVNGTRAEMNSGLFWLPHVMIAAPLPGDFTFGLGISAEYGLGTKFDDKWSMCWSCTETTVQGLVINPNIAYKITDKWSVGLGLRCLYFDFEQYRNMDVDMATRIGYPLGTPGVVGRVNYRLKGDNGWDGFGWQIGTKYDILDNLSVGIAYKAPIKTTIKGQTSAAPLTASPLDDGLARGLTGDADADIKLPQSVTFGANWDPVEDWHLGVSVSWTEWSLFDQLVFNIPQGDPNLKVPVPTQLDWKDTWRGSLGVAYDFTDNWTAMISYTYDMDSTRSDQESAMLPPASRHILAGGLSWKLTENWEATLSYSCIFMHGFDMRCSNNRNIVNDPGEYHLKTSHGFCHAGGFSLTYRF